jgi:hypothetical protein
MKNLMIAIIAIAFSSCTKTGTNVTNQTQTDEAKILSWYSYQEPSGGRGRRLFLKINCDTTKVLRVTMYRNILSPTNEYTSWTAIEANKVTNIYDHFAGDGEVWYIFRFEYINGTEYVQSPIKTN